MYPFNILWIVSLNISVKHKFCNFSMLLVFFRENIQLHIIENLMFVYSSQLAIFLNYEIFNHVFFLCSLLIYFFTVDKNIFFYSLSHLLMYFYLINKTFALLSFPFLIKFSSHCMHAYTFRKVP